MVFDLYPHQQAVIDELRDGLRAGHRRQILALATGAGKTVIASHIAKSAVARGKRVLFIVDKIELVGQASRHFAAMDLTVGIMQGENTSFTRMDDVIVASIQTIRARTAPEWVDVIIIDECHVLHQAHIDLMAKWNALPYIGLSATPLRPDLGKHFTNLVRGPTVRWLTDNGFLVPVRAYCPGADQISRILDGVKVRAGDFLEKELAEALNQKELIGDIVKTWQEKGEARQTLCFAVDIAHSKSIAEDFAAVGVSVGHIDAHTPSDERREIITAFRAKEITILSSVNVLGIGFDVPDASCLILARPTLSEMLDMQQKGRGIRTAEGKQDCIILDHAGNTLRFGLPVHFEVPDLGAEDRETTKTKRKQSRMVVCPNCGYVLDIDQLSCPACGVDRPRRGPRVATIDGELVEYGSYADGESEDDPAYRERWYRSLKWIAESRGYKVPGWVLFKYREKFDGDMPPRHWRYFNSEEPEADVRRWVKSRQIAWAKSKAHA